MVTQALTPNGVGALSPQQVCPLQHLDGYWALEDVARLLRNDPHAQLLGEVFGVPKCYYFSRSFYVLSLYLGVYFFLLLSILCFCLSSRFFFLFFFRSLGPLVSSGSPRQGVLVKEPSSYPPLAPKSCFFTRHSYCSSQPNCNVPAWPLSVKPWAGLLIAISPPSVFSSPCNSYCPALTGGRRTKGFRCTCCSIPSSP